MCYNGVGQNQNHSRGLKQRVCLGARSPSLRGWSASVAKQRPLHPKPRAHAGKGGHSDLHRQVATVQGGSLARCLTSCVQRSCMTRSHIIAAAAACGIGVARCSMALHNAG